MRALRCETLERRCLLAVTAFDDFYTIGVDEALRLAQDDTVVAFESVWEYQAVNDDPTASDADFYETWLWKNTPKSTYDGPPFQLGSAPFASGNVSLPAQTEIGFYDVQTAYFLRSFEVAVDVAEVVATTADVILDDGAIFYLNGQEVGRVNIPSVALDTFDLLAPVPGPEGTRQTVSLANSVVTGTNYLAVSVHNYTDNPTFDGFDLGFEMQLRVESMQGSVLANDASDLADPPPTLRVVEVAGQAIGDEPPTIATTVGGEAMMQPNGAFNYWPPLGFFGVDSFTYTAHDGESSATATVVIIVSPPGKAAQDLNADSHIDIGDLAFLLASYGTSTDAKAIAGDLDGDGRIGLQDAIALRNAITPSPSPAAAIGARANARAIVASTSEFDELRARRHVRRANIESMPIAPTSTHQNLAPSVEESRLLTGGRSRSLGRERG